MAEFELFEFLGPGCSLYGPTLPNFHFTFHIKYLGFPYSPICLQFILAFQILCAWKKCYQLTVPYFGSSVCFGNSIWNEKFQLYLSTTPNYYSCLIRTVNNLTITACKLDNTFISIIWILFYIWFFTKKWIVYVEILPCSFYNNC